MVAACWDCCNFSHSCSDLKSQDRAESQQQIVNQPRVYAQDHKRKKQRINCVGGLDRTPNVHSKLRNYDFPSLLKMLKQTRKRGRDDRQLTWPAGLVLGFNFLISIFLLSLRLVSTICNYVESRNFIQFPSLHLRLGWELILWKNLHFPSTSSRHVGRWCFAACDCDAGERRNKHITNLSLEIFKRIPGMMMRNEKWRVVDFELIFPPRLRFSSHFFFFRVFDEIEIQIRHRSWKLYLK